MSSRTVLNSRKKLEALKSFQSAKSDDERLKSFKKMEKVFPESELAYVCFSITIQLFDSPDQVLSFGTRALRILIDNDNNNIPCFGNTFSKPPYIGEYGSVCSYYHKSSLYIAYLCNLLASACGTLKRYDEGMSYLNWANRNLITLLGIDDDATRKFCGGSCLLMTLLANQNQMCGLNLAMGRFDELVIHARKVLEIEESIMEEGFIGLGKTNELLSYSYTVILSYKEALPHCLKALEIYTKHFGSNSVEVARVMQQLALIYYDFEEYEKALEQNQLSINILKNLAPDSPKILSGENNTGYILIGLGRFEEAVGVLNHVVSHVSTQECLRGLAYVNLAKALFYLNKRAEAKKHMILAQKILEKKETCPFSVATGFGDMSVLFEKMNDFGRAISLLMKSLRIPNIPQKRLAQGSARLFSLICLSGKVKGGIAYMEDLVEILKRRFGPEHYEVGHGYKNLGATYLKSGKEHLAVKFMVKAKDIMDVTLGPHHLDSLKTSQTLAETYATLRRYDSAIEIQGKVLDSLKVMEPCEQELLFIAAELLNRMKESVAESRMGASPQSKDDEDLSAKISKCVISDDEIK